MISHRGVKRWLLPVASLLIAAGAFAIVHAQLRHVRYHEVVQRVRDIPSHRVAAAVGFTMLVYLVLPLYDLTALRYVGHPLPRRRVVFASMIAYAISQTLGFAALTGSAVRFRFWNAWGVSSAEIARAVAFVGVTFGLGLVTVSALAFLASPSEAATILHLQPVIARTISGVLVAGIALYVVGTVRFRGRSLFIRSIEVVVPAPRIVLRQLAIPLADWLLAAAVLYSLIPRDRAPGFLAFVSVFVSAQFVGLVSHVPGGVGVFDSVMLILLRPLMPTADTLGILLVYRTIYYLAPFAIAVTTLAAHEGWARRKALQQFAATSARWGGAVLPEALAAATCLAGLVLLGSGATPSVHSRLAWLERLIPLGVIEASHFIASLAGVGLVILAWALWHRLDAAWSLAVGSLGIGAVASLLKGGDWEEALILVTVLSVLLPLRKEFYRRGALLHEPLEPGWIVAVVGVVAASIWLGVFSYKHVQFRQDLWWQFTLHGDAPRFLRASTGAVASIAAFGLLRLLRHSPPEPAFPTGRDLDTAAAISRQSRSTEANLALLGDKRLLFSDQRDAMLMYGVEGRSWVALGDPIGADDDAVAELAWRFKESADEHGAWPVFYEVTDRRLPLYIDLGLGFLKLGEEGFVRLTDFSLEGSTRKGLRRTQRDFAKRGMTFEVVPSEAVPALLPDLRRVSDEWLRSKATREKGFSLGRFDDAYLARFPIAIVREGERITAFANVWLGAPGSELSVDLMRHTDDAGRGIMDYLFVELMAWGRDHGFAEFSLGMAPLSGLQDHALAPLWTRAGAWLFRHGEHFYNFQGLRQYKEKFDPEWRPRFLASPGGLALPRILVNVATLISGGAVGLVTR